MKTQPQSESCDQVFFFRAEVEEREREGGGGVGLRKEHIRLMSRLLSPN